MKLIQKSTLAAAVVALFVVGSGALYAGGSHSKKHGHGEEEFEPTTTEFGRYDPGMHVTRTIEVGMSDQMRFTPNVIKVKKGDVIKFVHSNDGKLLHEFVLGTPDSLDEHAVLMKKFPGMEHSEPYMAHVEPGKHGEIIWKFSEEGTFAFGCLIPGHYDAGMKGTVIVES